MKLKTYILSLAMASTVVSLTTSCDDMLDKGNDYVIYADDHMLVNPSDTVTSVLGILNKLQGIAVRTNLLGEVRADLVKVNSNATSDLKELANLSVSDDNEYNVPRDYFAVINNCNYYLAHVDSLAGNSNRNEKYFENEIAQVHSIRAWAYLQLVLVYGKVPLVTEPVLTKLQSDASYPNVELAELCDYFIKDLQPYYGQQYPEYTTIGGDINPKQCFYPTQIVMGDLYLWEAAASQNKELAKKAAKCYYDYLVWNQNGKIDLYTGDDRAYWSEDALKNGSYRNPYGKYSWSTSWGGKSVYQITSIPMDSAAADGYYNELRNLYNTTNNTELKEASISPSSCLKSLSEAQDYYGWDDNKNVIHVSKDKFTDEQLSDGYYGDLRYQRDYSTKTLKYNSKEYDSQYIIKHNLQHVSIYRASQIYLRMAEALNYGGYPRFARQILTMGLSNNVIDAYVMPYYTSDEDQSYISSFSFNTNSFIPYAISCKMNFNDYGVFTGVTTTYSSTTSTNMYGIHSMGSGLAFLNPDYCALETPDSTDYPFDEEATLGTEPVEENYTWPTKIKEVKAPCTWEQYPNQTLSSDDYAAFIGAKSTSSSTYEAKYTKYVDSVKNFIQYIDVDLPAYIKAYSEVEAQFESDLAEYVSAVNNFYDNYTSWYKSAYSDASLILNEQKTVDQAILDEQALELSYEGNRYYDLMRRALWWGDNSKIANPISKRTSAGSLLMNKNNWYLSWKGKIGY